MHRTTRQAVCLSLAVVVLVGGSPVVGLKHVHCQADRPHRYDDFLVDGCPHAAGDALAKHVPADHVPAGCGTGDDCHEHDQRPHGQVEHRHADHQIDVHWHYFWLGIELGEIPAGDDGASRLPTPERIVAAPIAGELMLAERWLPDSGSVDAAVCPASHVASVVNTARSHLLATGPGDAVSPLCDAARLERTGVRLC